MTCGIYQLIFSSGKRYIGQSVDIENRWKQHFDKMQKGTAAISMQREYSACGLPQTFYITECHRDYLDILESIYIHIGFQDYGNNMLNTSIPKGYTQQDINILVDNKELLMQPIIKVFSMLTGANNRIGTIQFEKEDALQAYTILRKTGKMLPAELQSIHSDNKKLKEKVREYEQAINNFKTMPWWKRIWL